MSEEKRLPSDTYRLNLEERKELEQRLEQMRAEMAEPEPLDPDRAAELRASYPEPGETCRECPACTDGPERASCPTCKGAGMVTWREWSAWMNDHAPSALVTCPKCRGEGEVPRFEETSRSVRASRVRCSLCVGDKKVRRNFGSAWEREQARPHSDE